jgi:hypothetical protein
MATMEETGSSSRGPWCGALETLVDGVAGPT